MKSAPSASSLASTRITPIAAPDERRREDDGGQRARQHDDGHQQHHREWLEHQAVVEGAWIGPAGWGSSSHGMPPKDTPGDPQVRWVRMRRTALFLCCFGVFALWYPLGHAPSAATTTDVVVLKVEGAIDRPLLQLPRRPPDVRRRPTARSWCCSSTPRAPWIRTGWRSASGSSDMDVPVIAFVGPTTSPTNASGAGLLLMYASSLERGRPRLADRTARTRSTWPTPIRRTRASMQTIQGWLDARGKDTSLDWDDRPLTAQDAIDLGIATEVAPVGPRAPQRDRRPDGADGRRARHAATPASPPPSRRRTRARSTSGSTTSGRSSAWPTGSPRRR